MKITMYKKLMNKKGFRVSYLNYPTDIFRSLKLHLVSLFPVFVCC